MGTISRLVGPLIICTNSALAVLKTSIKFLIEFSDKNYSSYEHTCNVYLVLTSFWCITWDSS